MGVLGTKRQHTVVMSVADVRMLQLMSGKMKKLVNLVGINQFTSEGK